MEDSGEINMANIVLNPSTHSGRLERWLGTETVEGLSKAMRGWYGPPIGVGNVPGVVYAHGDGDFSGPINGGGVLSFADFVLTRARRAVKLINRNRRRSMILNAGFASLSDLISEATVGGKRREFPFQKVGPTGVASVTSTLWRLGNQPAAGAAGSAAPGGRATDSTVTGAFPFTNPTGGDTQHIVAANLLATVVPNTLLLYDRLFDVAKTMNSTGTEAVSGVPTRYTNTTAGQVDSISGNFLFVEVGGTALAATAHNWTVCTYTDQTGAGSTLPSLAGNSGAIVDRLDHPTNQWFAPLETGDTGIKALTQMQCNALVATGAINFVIGHPIAWMPCPIANIIIPNDYINTAFNLARIFDSACLAFLEVIKPATTATTYTGSFTTVAG
jgi:hypothetical protein